MSLSPADVLKSAVFNLDIQSREYQPAIRELAEAMGADPRILDKNGFEQAVLAREEESTTAIGSGVSFPHARTAFVSDIVLGIGRSAAGIAAPNGGGLIHLIFLTGTPKRKIQEYLMIVGFLARAVKQQSVSDALLQAGTPDAFIKSFGVSAK